MLKIGSKAPFFSLLDQDRHQVALDDFLGSNVVLYFYPKDMTPGCTKESCDFRDNLNKFKSKNTDIIGISSDTVETHKKFQQKYNLNFKLLADTEGEVCKKYNVLGEKSLFGVKRVGILRTTFLIDPEGRVKKVFPKVKVLGHAKKVLDHIAG